MVFVDVGAVGTIVVLMLATVVVLSALVLVVRLAALVVVLVCVLVVASATVFFSLLSRWGFDVEKTNWPVSGGRGRRKNNRSIAQMLCFLLLYWYNSLVFDRCFYAFYVRRCCCCCCCGFCRYGCRCRHYHFREKAVIFAKKAFNFAQGLSFSRKGCQFRKKGFQFRTRAVVFAKRLSFSLLRGQPLRTLFHTSLFSPYTHWPLGRGCVCFFFKTTFCFCLCGDRVLLPAI